MGHCRVLAGTRPELRCRAGLSDEFRGFAGRGRAAMSLSVGSDQGFKVSRGRSVGNRRQPTSPSARPAPSPRNIGSLLSVTDRRALPARFGRSRGSTAPGDNISGSADAVLWREVPVEGKREGVRRDCFRKGSEPRTNEPVYPVVVEPLARGRLNDDKVFKHRERRLMNVRVDERHRALDDADDVGADSAWEPRRARPGRGDVLTGQETVIVVPVKVQGRFWRL